MCVLPLLIILLWSHDVAFLIQRSLANLLSTTFAASGMYGCYTITVYRITVSIESVWDVILQCLT
jgi:hypothetical protein